MKIHLLQTTIRSVAALVIASSAPAAATAVTGTIKGIVPPLRQEVSARQGACPLPLPDMCQLYARAVDGDLEAKRQIGLAYLGTNHLARSEPEAANWLRQAAEGGLVAAQADYAELLLHSATERHEHAKLGSLEEAVSWLKRAAAASNVRAQNRLGTLYATGRGVPRNAVEAVRWFDRAAGQGYAPAQLNLGVAYQLGDGVRPNIDTAQNWFRRAALQGEARAMLNLGSILTRNLQDEARLEEGYAWLLTAEMRGDDEVAGLASSQLDQLAQHLSSEQHQRAVVRADQLERELPTPADILDGGHP